MTIDYSKFTDRSRKVLQHANQEAQRFNHEVMGTQHLLLGLIKEGGGVAANVLKNLGIDLAKARQAMEDTIAPGPDMVTMGNLPTTPCVRSVLQIAILEAAAMKHEWVGTEHILLGMLGDPNSQAGRVLTKLGVSAQEVRRETLELLGHSPVSTDPQKAQVAHDVELEKRWDVVNFAVAEMVAAEVNKALALERKEILALLERTGMDVPSVVLLRLTGHGSVTKVGEWAVSCVIGRPISGEEKK